MLQETLENPDTTSHVKTRISHKPTVETKSPPLNLKTTESRRYSPKISQIEARLSVQTFNTTNLHKATPEIECSKADEEPDLPFFLVSNRKSGRKAENVNLTVTFVYGFNQVEDRHSLWDELHLLNVSTPLSRHPWAVAGDFNQILRSTHHSNHQWINVDTSGIDDFNLALQDAELFEAQAKGLPLTWWNNQDDNPISKKIDHALINQKWSDLFPDAYADFLEPQQSDHAVCLFRVPSLQRHLCKPFKFFHHVIDHLEYEDSVKEAWNCETYQQAILQWYLRESNSTS
ncbi:uncharacterized protein LOC110229056 [Arabidopsis lyrata subsp. lyrata]|uniref:uncharacterized protein LOC110229056 n=1 Tax=Arabidopsis lyrata subsp. lyrata TaxID=81972 RepID=UPI000A29B199|nr:uncharacterized protein LOC110229056 [Arabidopsis lyrata subsp. lyrata]|eukprot:XP_020883515.1 uncharacterized protein LOC110229056 [Arabidopsis lyrata subsp. lyrata]